MKKNIIALTLSALFLFVLASGLNREATENAQEHHIWLMQTLLPGSESFTVETYTGDDANIRSVHKAENGYVIETATHGYVDEIIVTVAVNNEGKVMGLVVNEAHETFGLGNQVLSDHEFLSQFLNSAGSFAVATEGADAFSGATDATTGATSSAASDENAVDVDAITGATVTSKAVVRCVNSAVAYVTGADASTGATTWGG